MLDETQLALDAKAELGEGPSWDEKMAVTAFPQYGFNVRQSSDSLILSWKWR